MSLSNEEEKSIIKEQIDSLVEFREGWWWPTEDTSTWKFLNNHFDLPTKVSKYVDKKNVVVQAGGNCGMYPKQYGEIFNTVYTFEPDWLNFYCLVRNCPDDHIIKSQACLGDKPDLVKLKVRHFSRGKSFINGKGRYPVYLIDNLGLTECDLIHLDIEGYEYFALNGAVETIKKFQPVIAIEMWDQLDERFGENMNSKTESLLSSLGYTYIEKLNETDKIYIHESKNYNTKG
jgi:FkbM family methyltransferase